MSRVSSRHQLALLALLATALGASYVHVRAMEPTDPCLHPEVLTVTSMIPGSSPQGERMELRSDDVVQWSEGLIPGSGLHFQIVRFYGSPAKLLRPYHVSEAHFEPDRQELHRVETERGPVEVEVMLQDTQQPERFVAYFYADGNDTFSNGFLHLIASAPSQLVHGPRPLALFLVEGPLDPGGRRVERAVQWLGDAWAHYAQSCFAR